VRKQDAITVINSSNLRVAFITNPHLLKMACGDKCRAKFWPDFDPFTADDVYEALGITDQHRAQLLALHEIGKDDLAHAMLDAIIDGEVADLSPAVLQKVLPELDKCEEIYCKDEPMTDARFAKAIIEIEEAITSLPPFSNKHLVKMALRFRLGRDIIQNEEMMEYVFARVEDVFATCK
jgi:hypothetical protein